jgi:hypothetical protein
MAGLKPLESDIHKQVATYLDIALPLSSVWSTIGHGGMPLHPRTAARLKAQGLKPGIPDVLIVWKGRAIFIEIKRPGGRLSPAQKAMHERITSAGAVVTTCFSAKDVERYLSVIMPLRATVAA